MIYIYQLYIYPCDVYPIILMAGLEYFQRQLQSDLIAELHDKNDGDTLASQQAQVRQREGEGRKQAGRRERKRCADEEHLDPGQLADYRALPQWLEHVTASQGKALILSHPSSDASTPPGLLFQIIRDMRRSSSHVRRVGMKFRFAQVVMNAVALLALGGGMAAYLKRRSLI